MKSDIKRLTQAHSNCSVKLVSIEAGWGMRRRLAAMGLREGSTFRVLQAYKQGPCIVLSGNTRLVLGHGMSYKLLVKEVEDGG